MQLRTHSYAAFRKHAKAYLEPAIIHSWTEWQTHKLQTLSKATSVILGGDMRADSPGTLLSVCSNVYALYQQF